MRILLAPQEFKGTLSARQAARALADGLRDGWPEAVLDLAPLADGGPGTVEALLEAAGGERRTSRVHDPLGRPVEAAWGLIDGSRTAVLEMAAASGLSLVSQHERAPLLANTLGTGELVTAALDAGCNTILLGVGGSATNDGGLGAAMALGVRFLDGRGALLPPEPRRLLQLARIELQQHDARLDRTRLVVLTDVQSPLCGPKGASHVFGPQKGADEAAVRLLDEALAHLARIAREQLDVALETLPGAGAAGGLAYGLAAFCGATLQPGFEAVAKALRLPERVEQADWVLTGEGRLDAQTACGKGPAALARLARAHGKKVAAFVGSIFGPKAPTGLFDEIVEVTPEGLSAETPGGWASERLRAAAISWARAKASGQT